MITRINRPNRHEGRHAPTRTLLLVVALVPLLAGLLTAGAAPAGAEIRCRSRWDIPDPPPNCPREPHGEGPAGLWLTAVTCERTVYAGGNESRLRDQIVGGGCGLTADGIRFQLEHTDAGWTDSRFSGEDGPGEVGWYSLPPGSVKLWGEVPAGFGEPIVQCQGLLRGAGGVIIDFVPSLIVRAHGGVFEYRFRPGEEMICGWIIAPLP